MTEKRAVYRVASDQAPLAGTFDDVLQRVASSPTTAAARVLAAFAAALANSEEFNLEQIEQLPEQVDQDLCLSLFEYCMSVGLAEDERQAIAAAFAPYVEIHAAGTRH